MVEGTATVKGVGFLDLNGRRPRPRKPAGTRAVGPAGLRARRSTIRRQHGLLHAGAFPGRPGARQSALAISACCLHGGSLDEAYFTRRGEAEDGPDRSWKDAYRSRGIHWESARPSNLTMALPHHPYSAQPWTLTIARLRGLQTNPSDYMRRLLSGAAWERGR